MQKMPKCFTEKSIACLLSLFILASDQLSKYVVAHSMYLGEIVRILPFFNIVRVENHGVTFGLLSGALPPIILAVISMLVVIFVLFWIRKNMQYIIPVSMIVGGAVGNIIDRFIYKAVIDFLDFHAFGFHWPAFNIADSTIVIGTAIMFLISYGECER